MALYSILSEGKVREEGKGLPESGGASGGEPASRSCRRAHAGGPRSAVSSWPYRTRERATMRMLKLLAAALAVSLTLLPALRSRAEEAPPPPTAQKPSPPPEDRSASPMRSLIERYSADL